MKIRTIYFKVPIMKEAVDFWRSFTGREPHKRTEKYSEFRADNINLGLVLNDFGDEFSGSNCCPVFEFADSEVQTIIERAKNIGAIVVLDALNDPNIKGVIFADPWGNEFEVTKFHD